MFEPLVIAVHKLLWPDNARIREIARSIPKPVGFAEFKPPAAFSKGHNCSDLLSPYPVP